MIRCDQLEIDGILLFQSEKHKDSRGSFSEVYRSDTYLEFLPNNINFVQDNESYSKRGVLRGLHFQKEPFEQSKLIRVSHGEIQDVVVDIRSHSKTFGKHISLKLSKENQKQLFIPKGFAHGFLVLSDFAIVNYKVDNYYSKDYDSGVLFNDPDLDINWELNKLNIQVSQKDLKLPKLNNIQL